MSDPSTWHRLSNIDPVGRLATCSQCGPGVPIMVDGTASFACKFRKDSRRVGPHGMTRIEAREYLKGKKCGICGTTENLVVDHCHDSLRVRGPLCDNHNKALGLFEDSVEELRAAIEYLLGVDSPLPPL